MSSQKFKSVNDEFLIRNSISDELLDKCFTFVNNQRRIERTKIEEAYKKNISQSIKFPQNIRDEGVDVVIKSKFNNNDKLIGIAINGLSFSIPSSINITKVPTRFCSPLSFKYGDNVSEATNASRYLNITSVK